MDYTEIVSYIASFLLGIGSVLLIIKKYYLPAKEVADVILEGYKALKDGNITEDELKSIIKEAKDVPEAIAKIKENE